MTLARSERLALVDAMAEVGPDAPTLCGDWKTRDLAAHLVVRERRLDASAGISVPLLAGYTKHVQNQIAAQPWEKLLEQVRSGPPIWSPFWLLDSRVNLSEMFVHHEDVRRGGDTWDVRELSDHLQDRLWDLAKVVSRKSYKSSPVTVVLERAGGAKTTPRRAGAATVTLRGEPSELLLHAFGRDKVHLEALGSATDVHTVMDLDRSF